MKKKVIKTLDNNQTKSVSVARTSQSRLIVAKLISLLSFGFVLLFLLTEVCTFAMYGLPYLSTEIARNVGVQSGADWVVGCILWGFPTLFLTIVLALLHVYLVRMILGKVWRWMVAVMKKSVDNC